MTVDHGNYQELVNGLIDNLIKIARQYLSSHSLRTVQLAFEVANHAHYGQFRKSGEPYITHPLEVATFVAQWGLDEKTIAGAMMHDVIEDTAITKEDLSRIFNLHIAELVDSVTKLDKMQLTSDEINHAEYCRKVILSIAKDTRVILIKLADRMHNMSTLSAMKPDKRYRIARETMEIYVPIANQIGLHRIHLELSEASFKYIYPFRHQVLLAAAANAQASRIHAVEQIIDNLSHALRANGIDVEFIYRPRAVVNLYSRMRKRHQPFKMIYDIFEIKTIVATIGDCYLALGVMHSMYQPVPGKVKDYIASPKINGYQSLHSTMLGPDKLPIQIHIRTATMEKVAEYGVMNDWLTNEDDGGKLKPQLTPWLDNILDIQANAISANDFLDNIKKEFSSKNIYLFTPKGEIIHLPLGSIAIDFAYAIHTDIGNHFQKALINQHSVSDDYKLQTGDMVEIITNTSSHPSEHWLDMVVSGRASSCIKHYLRDAKTSDYSINASVLLVKLSEISALDTINIQSLNQFIATHYSHLTLQSFEQQLGSYTIAALKVLSQIVHTEILTIVISKLTVEICSHSCCYPLPEERILAQLTIDHLEIHTIDCQQLQKHKSNHLFMPIVLYNDCAKQFLVKLTVVVYNLIGVLSELSAIFTAHNTNVEAIQQDQLNTDNIATLNISVLITTINTLKLLISAIASKDFVLAVNRMQ